MTDDHDDKRLQNLGRIETPRPDAAARRRALAAANLAFEAEQKKSHQATQGSRLLARLRSIVPNRGNWTMDMRIPLGTAALTLLLLPLGYQLYSTTALTQPRLVPANVPVEQPVVRESVQDATPPVDTTVSRDQDVSGPALQTETLPQVAGRTRQDNPLLRPEAAVGEGASAAAKSEVQAIAPEPQAVEDMAATDGTIASQRAAPVEQEEGQTLVAPTAPLDALEAAPQSLGATTAESDAAFMPAPMPQLAEQGLTVPLESGDEFTSFTENPVKVTAEEPVSTFSIDVDTASYSYVRSMLADGYLPDPDAVRIEEMINYFPYDYALPEDASAPFKPTMAIYPTPWNPRTQILHIGIKGFVPPAEAAMPSNLVFLIDTSGSMDEPNRMPLVKRAFALLVEELGPEDTVSIVVYAGSAGVVLEPTKGTEKAEILSALDNLYAGGSTAGAEGIELAYRVAEQGRIPGGINRVVLATDGDFNVGIADPEQLTDFIKEKRETGISLSVLGFGMGNYQDDTMQALAQNGNGNAAYIDSFREAQKVLVEELGGTLQTIAKDVKIQIEFNPAFVSEYRLIGYETRALNRQDFNNDKVDAGDIGAGHSVTALYEITPKGSGAELVDPLRFGTETPPTQVAASRDIAHLKLRYKLPEGETSTLMETPVGPELVSSDMAGVPEDLRFAAAVAAFGQKLKGSDYAGSMSYEQIRQLALGARGTDENGYRSEFIQMVKAAERLE